MRTLTHTLRLLLLFVAACVVQPQRGQTTTPVSQAPPTDQPAPSTEKVVRAKQIHADKVVARVIYAKEVHAKGGRVGTVDESKYDESWEEGQSDDKLHVTEVTADVIYAKEIKADWIQADEIHAKKVKIGK